MSTSTTGNTSTSAGRNWKRPAELLLFWQVSRWWPWWRSRLTRTSPRCVELLNVFSNQSWHVSNLARVCCSRSRCARCCWSRCTCWPSWSPPASCPTPRPCPTSTSRPRTPCTSRPTSRWASLWSSRGPSAPSWGSYSSSVSDLRSWKLWSPVHWIFLVILFQLRSAFCVGSNSTTSNLIWLPGLLLVSSFRYFSCSLPLQLTSTWR